MKNTTIRYKEHTDSSRNIEEVMIMSAEDKLEEAKYFLDILKKISRTITADSQWKEGRDVHAIEPIFKYNFNACVQALRSVFYVLLYDYAEKYFKYSLERQYYMDEKKFSKIARKCGSSESNKFIKWYRQKSKELRKLHLWDVRVTAVHRGGRWMETKLKNILTKKGNRTEEIYFAGMPETVAVSECKRIHFLMDEIVKEARKKFNNDVHKPKM